MPHNITPYGRCGGMKKLAGLRSEIVNLWVEAFRMALGPHSPIGGTTRGPVVILPFSLTPSCHA